jgi:hypothetical protein
VLNSISAITLHSLEIHTVIIDHSIEIICNVYSLITDIAGRHHRHVKTD